MPAPATTDPFRAWLARYTRWGYSKKLAAALGVSTATLRNWRSGKTVRADHHERVIAAAKADGIALAPRDLVRAVPPVAP